MFPANQLIGEMNRLGVNFVVGDRILTTFKSLSAIELMAGLAAHKDARIRLALIPVLLQLPEFAEEAPESLVLLEDDQKIIFKLYYTAAYLLQLSYKYELQVLIDNYQDIQDFFSKDLNVSRAGTVQDRLWILAKRHKEITKMSINWYGTYHHAAKRVLKRLQKEREWAKV
jgi:hypothetical protein